MRIAYIGNFTQRHCTEVHIGLTLEDLGHEVIRIQENNADDNWFDDVLSSDLLLFTRTWGDLLTLEHLTRLREKGIPSASYHLDLYVGISRESGLDNDPFWRTDFVFTPDGSDQASEVFKKKGINHHYIKPAVYRGECNLFEKDDSYDVIFVGGGAPTGEPNQYGHSEWPYRGKLLKFLTETFGDRFKKFGYPDQTIRNEKLNQLYADAKIVVGDSLCINFDHPYYWSDRVYETMGRGGFIIHPYIKGMEEEFTDGVNIVFYEYNNWDQLEEKINYYLEHDGFREMIRLNGHNFVKENATYHNRLTQALGIINSAEGQPTLPSASGADLKINLGAGSEPAEGWINTDWLPLEGIDKVFNLLETPYPFDDGVASEIKAIDVLEHMPNYTPDNQSTPIKFIEEIHRILKVGGVATIQVPHYQSPNLWIDPTHVRGYDPKSLDYFDPETDIGKWYGYYSEKKFKVSSTVSYMEDGQPSNVTFRLEKI